MFVCPLYANHNHTTMEENCFLCKKSFDSEKEDGQEGHLECMDLWQDRENSGYCRKCGEYNVSDENPYCKNCSKDSEFKT